MNLTRRVASLLGKLVLCFLLVVVVADTAAAATIRGRLDRVAPNGYRYPASAVAVTAQSPYVGRSNPAFTAQDGMYYLYNVPPGYYTLEVWWSRDPNVPPAVYQIQVIEPLTDLAPIVVP
ncbi:MAG: hypothetical protein ACLPLR_14250 [Terriglobales bacterium]